MPLASQNRGWDGRENNNWRTGTLHTIARLIKAMLGIAVTREDNDLVASVLQPNGGVNDKPLRAADA
jgi:hypothetical protein